MTQLWQQMDLLKQQIATLAKQEFMLDIMGGLAQQPHAPNQRVPMRGEMVRRAFVRQGQWDHKQAIVREDFRYNVEMEFNIDLFSLFNPAMGAELGLPIFLWPVQCQDSRGIVQVIKVNSGL